jgi:hypothetical protein
MTDTVWQCEQVRAGQVTNRILFDNEKQATEFLAQMRKAEPDLFWRMQPIAARMVWN